MSSTPVAAGRPGLRSHTDALSETPGGATTKKKKRATSASASASASTPARKTSKKKSADAAPTTLDDTPKRPSLDRPVAKTPKSKLTSSSAAAAHGETTTKKPKRIGGGATPAAKKISGTVKQQPRLKLATSSDPRLSRDESLVRPAPSQGAVPGTPSPVPTQTTLVAPASSTSQARHTSSPSPGRTSLSPGATSLLSTSSVGVGRRFEPNAYKRMFAVTGSYNCLECVPQTASLWVGDVDTGAIEIYNSLTGHLTTTIPAPGADNGAAASPVGAPRRSSVHARADRLALSTTSQRSAMSAATGVVTMTGPLAAIGATPTALRATPTHMFVGYSNGTVAVYDHLVLQFVTEGRFHTGRVIDFCLLKDGTVVSASDDGALVHWDRESTNFEAITRVLASEGTSEGRMTALAAATAPQSMQKGNHVVLCGFSSGAILIIDVVTGRELQALHGHTKPLLDMAVLGEFIFTTAEDGAVLVWSNRVSEMMAPASALALAGGAQRCKLLRRIPVQPNVSAFLADHHSGSIWVAFTDGLLERWSAQADDDFGVEEVVREGMVRQEPGSALTHHPTRLIAMGAADTLQVLALSSNGVNKVWYGHRNSLEEHLSASIHALNKVIEQDSEDTAAWRERLNLLKQKEVERKSKYVVILEQLSELRVLLDYFDRWRQYRGRKHTAASAERQVAVLQHRTEFALARRYFSQWASFYNWQQGRFRRHVLSRALEDATRRAQVSYVFHRWQAGLVQRRLQQSRLDSVRVMQHASEDLLCSKAYYQWRQFAHRRRARHISTGDTAEDAKHSSSRQMSEGLSSAQLELIAAKAQRQVLARSMARWQQQTAAASTQHHQQQNQVPATTSALRRYTSLMVHLKEEAMQRNAIQLWRRWVPMRQRRRALAAVATLRAQQADYVLQQDFFYRWIRFAYAARLRANAKEIEAVTMKLRKAEAEHGDIFEKLQLQKRVDQLIQDQTAEEAALDARLSSLRSLRESYAALQKQVDTPRSSEATAADGDREASPPALEPPLLSSAAGTGGGGAGPGMMVSHADYYNSLIDEQRLSPAVLSQMPAADGIQHVMGQLKANTLNMYTDMALFRQVKDRRRSGTTAAAIFLEAFSEVKRLVSTSTSTGAGAGAGAASSATGPAARWPLCMEALDCIPTHHCASVLTAIKTLVVAFDLVPPEDAARVSNTSEEIVANADWILLIARACYLRRRPLLPSNNR